MTRKDNRKYPRMNVSLPVDCVVGEKSSRERALTLGGGGMFLAIAEPPAVGAQITVRFRPAKHLDIIEAKGRVCYQVPGKGIGVEFTDIKPEFRQALLRFILGKKGDKRRHPRVPLLMQIECEQFTSLAYSRDVSVGGVFIETKQPLAVGSELNLRFRLENESPIIVARAEVKYEVVKLGMGVLFIELSPDDRKRIETYVAMTPELPEPAPPST